MTQFAVSCYHVPQMKYGRYLILPAIALIVAFIVYPFPQFSDYERVFYVALHNPTPYSETWFVFPRYLPLLMWPLRWLPAHASGAAWMGISAAIVVYVIHRLEGDVWAYLLVFTSPGYFIFVRYGNVEALILLGLVMTAPFDVLLMGIKPQTAVLAIIKRLTEYGRKEWAWLTGLVLLSFIAWGFWVLPMLGNWIDGPAHQASLDIFPWGIVAGLVIVGLYWRDMTAVQLAIASYLFTPYITPSAAFVPVTLMLATFNGRHKAVIYGMMWALFIVASVRI